MNESQADVELRAERDGLHHYPVPSSSTSSRPARDGSGSAISNAVVRALDEGTCVLGTRAHRDYHNNVVPARADVAPGEKGTLEYANRLRADRGAPLLVEAADGTVSEAQLPSSVVAGRAAGITRPRPDRIGLERFHGDAPVAEREGHRREAARVL